MANLIEGRGLFKRYEGFTLDNLDICVPPGYVVGLIGSNGAGKSTLIKALLRSIDVDGEVRVFGEPPHGTQWKQRIGVVFDTCSFPPAMRSDEIAGIGRQAYANWDDSLFSQLMDTYGIPAGKEVKDLSRGMGMKLSLAFALAHHPDLLILDEPTAGLDPIARDEALDLLLDFMEEEGHGILMSSHITTDLERIADRIVCIDDGKLVFSMAKDDICDVAGIAHCTEAQFETLRASDAIRPDDLRYLRRDFQIDVLVPDRFAFGRAFPEVACEAADIDGFLRLMLKGAIR